LAEFRHFNTGATRSTNEGKLEYRRCLSPTVLRRYAEFMHKNRIRLNGELREPDNWKMGIPLDSYLDSLGRHFMEIWLLHDGHEVQDEKGDVVDLEVALCALIFNASGYLHELLKIKESK
jgi:hypothetical protein